MESLQEFTERTCKKKKKGPFKIRNSFGVYDAYRHIRKQGWPNISRPVKEHEYYSIIRTVNKLFAEELALGNPIKFPHRMGRLELRRKEKGVSIVDGKLKIGYCINWADTLKLWYEDAEARKNKTLLRIEDKDYYTISYRKYEANYTNMIFYQFTLNRFIRKALSKNIKEGITDTLWDNFQKE